MKKLLKSSIAILLTAILMVGCGGNNNQTEVQPASTPPVASQLVGNWHMTSTNESLYDSGLSTGWGYDMYFFEDGTGIEWWFSAYSGWQEVFHFSWESNGNGEVVIAYTDANLDVLVHYVDLDFAAGISDILNMNIPFVYTYSITSNSLTLTFDDITSTFARNEFRATPLITSELVGEWHIIDTNALFYTGGLDIGWEYDFYFFDDGTGIEWWYSPDSGWHDIFYFLWFAKDGEVIITYTALNYDILSHYIEGGMLDDMLNMLQEPTYARYTIVNNRAEIYFYNVFTHIMQRN